jgi:hypothetical protein
MNKKTPQQKKKEKETKDGEDQPVDEQLPDTNIQPAEELTNVPGPNKIFAGNEQVQPPLIGNGGDITNIPTRDPQPAQPT